MYLPRPAADGPAPSDKVITYVAFPETFPLQSSCMGVLCTSRRRQLQPWELGIFCDILEIQASRKPGGVFLVMGTQRGLAHRGCQVEVCLLCVSSLIDFADVFRWLLF